MTEQIELLPQFERYAAWYNPCDRKIYQGKAPIEYQAAGIVGVSDLSAVDLKILLQEILGLQRPAYNLRNLTRQINMNALKASVPVYTKLTANEKVGELVESPVSAGDWATVDFSLWKNVVHIVVSDEAQKRANVDVFGTQTRDAAGALTASENSQIKTVLEAETTASGTDWGGDNNPYDDLIGVMSTIAAKGYPADFVAAHPLVWGDFFGNKYVKGQLAGASYPDFTLGGGFPIIGLPGITGFSDFALTNTIAIVGSKNNACVLGIGPTEAARFRNELTGYDAYIIRQYLQPQVVVPDAIRVLTGIHA